MGLRYGGKIVDDYSAMRGPCPEGFHVPSDSERVTLCGILTTTFSLSSNATTMGTYLKMPMAGFRNYSSASVSSLGTYGSYRSLSSRSQDYTYYLRFSSSNISPQLGRYRSSGFSIRCFKNNPVIPNTSWVTLYQGGGSAGIYWDSTNGLISVSGDGLTWYTIHDKNLGATTVYNQGDTLTDANCGYFYQWGNNYGFAHSGTLTTSSTQVDASNYGPGNYYSSSTFIKRASSPYDWSSAQNDNLRGGETGVQQLPAPIKKRYYGGKMVDDYSAMRGPCDKGFHIPTNTEWTGVGTIMVGLGFSTGNSWATNLHLPLAKHIKQSDGSIDSSDTKGYYFASTPGAGTAMYRLYMTTSSLSTTGTGGRASGYSVRAFKDTFEVPNSNRTVITGTLGSAGIFRNQVAGLISITSDGSTGYTIMDKNLGATTVYNYGDTLSEANCGYFFQRGNNYGFPRTGPTITSSTAIDTTGYGPGNYYNNGTFITISGDWSSPANDDLRGGETGVQQRPAEVIKVYKGNTLIREKP